MGIFFLHTVLYSCAGKCRWNYIGSLLFSHASVVSRNIRIALIACARLMSLRAPYFTQRVHVYEAVSYDGEPEESEEMRPKWFSVTELPLKVRMPIFFFFLFSIDCIFEGIKESTLLIGGNILTTIEASSMSVCLPHQLSRVYYCATSLALPFCSSSALRNPQLSRVEATHA